MISEHTGRDARRPTTPKHSDELLALVKRRWAEGASASQVAGEVKAHLGVVLTRSAVCGLVHRHAFKRDTTNQRNRAAQTTAFWHRHRAAAAPVKNPKAPLAVTVEPPPPDARTGRPLVALLDLEAHQCRWPYGEVGKPGFGFCGGACVPGSSYCDHHARVTVRRIVDAVAEAKAAQEVTA